jgi:short-subunit dehydrogenase involved in D-alanine esterification of teichoic acids
MKEYVNWQQKEYQQINKVVAKAKIHKGFSLVSTGQKNRDNEVEIAIN